MKTPRTAAGTLRLCILRRNGPRLHGLRCEKEPYRRRHEQAEVNDERKAQRRVEVLREHACEQPSQAEAAQVRDDGDYTRQPRVTTWRQVHEHRRGRAREDAGRQPRKNPCGADRSDGVSDEKDQRAEPGEDEPEHKHRLASDLIREVPEDEQPGDHPEGVDREDHVHRERPEGVALGEQRIEWRWQRRADHRDEEPERHEREAGGLM